MSLIKAAGSGEVSTGFYKHLLDQSLKFNDDDTQYLTRTPASAGNRKTWTWSGWVKRGNLGLKMLFTAGTSGTSYIQIRFDTNDEILCASEQPGLVLYLKTTQKFRDTSAWYHIVVAMDTTQSNAADRTKLYVNGSLVTDFSSTTRPNQNTDLLINSTTAHMIGALSYGVTSGEYDGYMAEINFIDGTALTADSFGETKDGIWIPKDTSGLTFGTNGFHLTFKDDVVSEGFNTVTYTGNDATNRISGVGFQPDFVWLKNRDVASTHRLYNSLTYGGPYNAGATGSKYLASNSTAAETAGTANSLISLDADGFSVHGSGNDSNDDGEAYVGWCWEAGGAPTADNSAGAGATPTAGSAKIDGSNKSGAFSGSPNIAVTRLSANTARGFSIVTYTGSSNTSFPHGLSSAPKWVIIKQRSGTAQWAVYHTGLSSTSHYLNLDDTGAEASYGSAFINPGSTTITIDANSSLLNANGGTYIAYCFAEVAGYSSIGSYTGNGSTSGPTVTTGFLPAFLLIKRTDTADNWHIADNTRSTDGTFNDVLRANLTNAESANNTGFNITYNNTGFTLANANSELNANGGTYIYMAFADTREAAFFKDVSTNGNHLTPVNLDYRNSVPDVPTNNFATLNPLYNSISTSYPTPALSEGNLAASTSSGSNWKTVPSTMYMSTGKWYAEVKVTYTDAVDSFIGFASSEFNGQNYAPSETAFGYQFHPALGIRHNASQLSAQTFTQGDIIGLALNMDDNEIKFYKNGSLLYTATSVAAGSWSVALTLLYTKTLYANFGQDSSFAGKHATANSNADENGHGSFAYAPPSGFLALCSQNLPDVEIIDGTEYFNTVLWTGNGASSRAISGVGFSPDFVWAKQRGQAIGHVLYDSVRGVGNDKELSSNSTQAEGGGNSDQYGYLSSFDSDGFTGVDGTGSPNYYFNENSQTFVAWNWLAGTAFSNDASATGVGTIDSSGQVNATAGFSIVSYTGTGSNGTVAHGLGSVPKMIIFKVRNTTDNWTTYHAGIASDAETDGIFLNLTNVAQDQAVFFNDTAPTSSVFSIGTNSSVNGSSNTYIAYCFADVEGYSKVGSYSGNGSADGTFVFTGMAVSWLMVKRTDSTGNWAIYDKTRDTTNVMGSELFANLSNAEQSNSSDIDFLSNGFKMRRNYSENNSSGSYIYLAFAESPFKFANAR